MIITTANRRNFGQYSSLVRSRDQDLSSKFWIKFVSMATSEKFYHSRYRVYATTKEFNSV